MPTHLLIAQAAPTVPLTTVVYAVMASAGGVALAMVGVIKIAASYLPAVDAFFSSSKKKQSLPQTTTPSYERPGHACDATARQIGDMATGIARLSTTVERLTEAVDQLVRAQEVTKEAHRLAIEEEMLRRRRQQESTG